MTRPGTPTETTVERAASADAYVNGAATGSNYGTHQQLAVRGSSAYLSYLRFSVPSAPSGMVLKAAKLTVTTSSDPNAATADTVNVVPVTGDWSESAVTFANRPALGSGTLGSLSGASDGNTGYDIPLSTSGVGGSVGSTLDVALTSPGTDSLWLWARENGGTGPRLILTFGKP